MVVDLASQSCVPAGDAKLVDDADEMQEWLKEISGDWEVVEGRSLERLFLMNDFVEALELVNDIGAIAEAENHHPDLCIFDYNQVMVRLETHAVEGLTINDFIMAAKIEAL